jgi:hypothetical protein
MFKSSKLILVLWLLLVGSVSYVKSYEAYCSSIGNGQYQFCLRMGDWTCYNQFGPDDDCEFVYCSFVYGMCGGSNSAACMEPLACCYGDRRFLCWCVP